MFLKAVFSWTCTLCFHCRVKLGTTQLALKEVPGTKSTSSPPEPSRAEPCCAVERQPLLTSLPLWLFCRLRTCIIIWFHTASQHFFYLLLSGWLISVNQLKLVGTHSAVSWQKLLHWRPTSWHIFHQNSNNIFTSDVWFYYSPATWAALDTISHFSESGPDSWPIWVAVVLPGPVLLHEVYVLQSDVVEVGERHDGRRGDAVGCIWGAERKKKRCQRGRIISGLLTLYIQ